jgi:lactate permease
MGLVPLAAFAAGLSGLVVGAVGVRQAGRTGQAVRANFRAARWALGLYGLLSLLLVAVHLVPVWRASLARIVWQPVFPEVACRAGQVTPAGPSLAIRPLLHPGLLIATLALGGVAAFGLRRSLADGSLRRVAKATLGSALTPTASIVVMVGLSALMDHAGMTQALARGLEAAMGSAFPAVSPTLGVLGAFATGSNNNSNVLFGSLQKNVALLLGLSPALLASAQTAGGSLGSMLAPAKLVLGCATVGVAGQEGAVMRWTVPIGLSIALALGGVTLAMSGLLGSGLPSE